MASMAAADDPKPPLDHLPTTVADVPAQRSGAMSFGRLLFATAAALLVLCLLGTVVGLLTLAAPGVDRLVQSVEAGDPGQLPAAVRLADVLRMSRDSRPSDEGLLAARLAAVLRRQLDSAPRDPAQALLTVYLCRILGELDAPESLDALAEAAAAGKPVDVRRSAVEALAMLASHLPVEQFRLHLGCARALAAGCEDPLGEIRAATAFALGVIGGRDAPQRLRRLLSDPVADARYNAATALARLGDPAATPVLLEMLDAERIAALVGQLPRDRGANLDAVRLNALRAVEQLAAAHPRLDLAAFVGPVERLALGQSAHAIHVKALELSHQLHSR
jgi:hypothetical protein